MSEVISIKKYFYVKVIEAKDVVIKTRYYQSEPFVSIKMNGHEYIGKKRTNYHMGREWWDKIFKFTSKSPTTDWIAVEVREKGYHIVRSDWLGEVQVRIKDYADGKVHQKWFKLGGGAWKHHTRKPKGCIHLAFQLMENKFDHPFNKKPVEPSMTYEEWKQSLKISGQTGAVRYSKGIQKSISKEEEERMDKLEAEEDNKTSSAMKRQEKKSTKSESQKKVNSKTLEKKVSFDDESEKKDSSPKGESKKSEKKELPKESEKKKSSSHRKKGDKKKRDKSQEAKKEGEEEKVKNTDQKPPPLPPKSENLIEFSPLPPKKEPTNPFLDNVDTPITYINPFIIDYQNPFEIPKLAPASQQPALAPNPFLVQ